MSPLKMFTETLFFSPFSSFRYAKKGSVGGVYLSLLCPAEKLTALSLAKTPLLDVKAAS